MRVIKVPRVPASAFNPRRKASDLLRSQVEHLRHVVERKGGSRGVAAAARRVRTEAQAAAFIAKATKRLHPEGARHPVPAAGLPAVAPAPRHGRGRAKARPSAGTTAKRKRSRRPPSPRRGRK